MAINILKTKVTPPHLPQQVVSRSMLVERLRESFNKRLTLVLAPAGYGKTTLICQTLSRTPREVFWCTVEAAENEYLTFLRYFIAAFRPNETGIGQSANLMFNSVSSIDTEAILSQLINDLTTYSHPMLFVLDDLHEITNQKIYAFLDFFIQHVPPSVSIVLASRVAPPLKISRLRGQGEVCEIRIADLRFSDDEFRSFWRLNFGEILSKEDERTLSKKLEGWVSGMQLALFALQGNPDSQQLLKNLSGTNAYIADYFFDEVLRNVDVELKQFLISISFLRTASTDLCDHVLEIDTSDRLIQELVSRNMFIQFLDETHVFFKLHPLFRELLLHRLQSEMGDDEIQEFVIRAAVWLYANGFYEEAIYLAVVNANSSTAVRLMSLQAESLWESGNQMKLLFWLEQLGIQNQFPALPITLLLHITRIQLLSGKFTEAQNALAYLDSQQSDSLGENQAVIQLLHAALNFTLGAVEEALTCLKIVEDGLSDLSSTWHVFYQMLNGSCLSWVGNLESGANAFEQAIVYGAKLNQPYFELEIGFRLASTKLQMGEFQEVGELVRQCISLAEETGLSSIPLVGGFFAIEGILLAEKNRLGEAHQRIKQGIALGVTSSNIPVTGYAYIALFRVLFLQKDLTAIERALNEFQQYVGKRSFPTWLKLSFLKYQVYFYILTDQLDEAQQALQTSGVMEKVNPDLSHFDALLALANYLYARGVTLGDTGTIEDGLQMLIQLNDLISEYAMPLKQSQLNQFKVRFLHKLDRPQELSTLLDEINSNDDDFRMLHRIELLDVNHILGSKDEALIDPLTARELEVLNYLFTPLNTVEISNELCVSTTTVRSHIKNIYRKLNVHNRIEALEKARIINLLK